MFDFSVNSGALTRCVYLYLNGTAIANDQTKRFGRFILRLLGIDFTRLLKGILMASV